MQKYMQHNLSLEAGQPNRHAQALGDATANPALGRSKKKKKSKRFLLPINPMKILMTEGRSLMNLSSVLMPFVLHKANIQIAFKKSL